jgi:hypothetical protein
MIIQIYLIQMGTPETQTIGIPQVEVEVAVMAVVQVIRVMILLTIILINKVGQIDKEVVLTF